MSPEKKNRILLFLNLALPAAILFVLWGLWRPHFKLAWLAALVIVLMVEMRVRLRGRTRRSFLFWIHVPAALLFFLALTALVFVAQPEWLILAAHACLILGVLTGGMLWSRR